MRHLDRVLPATLALTLLLQGCSVTESENVRTAGISADIDVTSTTSDPDGQSRVKVTLRSGSGFTGTELELTGGDRLYVTVDGDRTLLSPSSGLFSTGYEAMVSSTSTHTEFLISFEREEDTSAPSSTVMLPEPFEVDEPAQSHYRFDDEVRLTWSPSGDGHIQLGYVFDCTLKNGEYRVLSGLHPLVDDDGSHTLKLGNLIPDGEDTMSYCGAEVVLKRTQDGQLDPNFGEGGSIQSAQERTATFAVSH